MPPRFDIPDDIFNFEQTELMRNMIGVISRAINSSNESLQASQIPITIPSVGITVPLQEYLEPIATDGEYQGGGVPKGTIIMFDGTLAEVRQLQQWKLCDGTGGTPDLRNQFIRGAGDGDNSGGTGGLAATNIVIDDHVRDDWQHTHTLNTGTNAPDSTTNVCGCNGDVSVADNLHTHSITDVTGDSDGGAIEHAVCTVPTVPPYYEVLFLRKK
jgi:hypothetical protein